MGRGRPIGSKSVAKKHIQGRNPPEDWTTKISELPQARHRLYRDEGAILPNNFGECTPYKAFRLMWTEEMDAHVIRRTNRRGTIRLDHSRLHRFLLSGLIMCVNVRKDYKLHWSPDPLFENPVLQELISRDEFRSALRHSHPKPQRLAHLANLNFKRHWNPFSHVSVDECLVCFKGRYKHRVHIRGKPDATGLKIYGLADERSYLYAFNLYKGKHQTTVDIVLSLVDQLPDFHFKVYADSWYGNDSLAFSLLQQGHYFTLACGKNKPSCVFNDYLDVNLVHGQCRYLQWEEDATLLALSYHDRAICHFLTNQFRPGTIENLKNEKIPAPVHDYRQFMGLLDRIDRSALEACWPHRNKRWTMAFFWYLLGLCINNAHKIFNNVNLGRISLPSFIHQLIIEWRKVLEQDGSAPRRPRHRLVPSTSKDRCNVCKHKDRGKGKTRLMCILCNVHLHPRCFDEYHKRP